MVVVRLARGGANKRPFYDIVVTDRRNSRDKRCVERIGYYNPIARGKEVRLLINKERVAYWLAQGAKPSDRVNHLIENYQEPVKEPRSAK